MKRLHFLFPKVLKRESKNRHLPMSDTVNFPHLYRIIYAFFKNVVKTILCKTQTYYNLPLLVLVIKWYKVQLKKNFTSDALFLIQLITG